MRQVVLLDTMYLMFRSHFSHKELATSDGEPTGALFGTLHSILAVRKQFPDWDIASCWDLEGKKRIWRKVRFAEYKKNRRKPSDPSIAGVIDQFAPLYTAFGILGIPVLRVDGLEADDVISVVVSNCSNTKFLVYSRDKDFYQLLDNEERIRILKSDSKRGLTPYSVRHFRRDFDIHPKHWARALALGADSSDNYKPIKGIGIKRALALVRMKANPALPYEEQPSKVKRSIGSTKAWDRVMVAYELSRIPRSVRSSKYDSEQSEELKRIVQEVRSLRKKEDIGKALSRFIRFCGRYEMGYLLTQRRKFFR